MSIPQIVGIPVDPADNDPVFVRWTQIEGSALAATIGYPVLPVYTNRPDFFQQRRYWQYFPNGMILCDFYTCAHVLYGPILDYYGTINQFNSDLGFPTTDVTQLPDGTSFVAFEHGVLWLDQQGAIHNLDYLAPIVVKAFSGVMPTPDGIAAFAQTKINTMIAQTIQNDPQLSSNVASAVATVAFETTSDGHCLGASFDTVGHTLPRAHIFRVHLEISLQGCASIFGNATADFHITVRLRPTFPSVSAFMESYTIDSVSTPGGIGQGDLTAGLSNALSAQFGVDMIGAKPPAGAIALDVIVDYPGNAYIYQEPMCMSSAMLQRSAQPEAEATLAQVRRLRDEHLAQTAHGKELIQIIETFGPVVTEAVRREDDVSSLRDGIARFLVSNFGKDANLSKISHTISGPGKRAVSLLNHIANDGKKDEVHHILRRCVRFLREEIPEDRDLETLCKSLSQLLEQEQERIAKNK